MYTQSETHYRSAAVEGATYIGLLLVVYDAIAEDLRRAGEAAGRNDISARCTASNHALLLLGHLESWVDSVEDAALKASLAEFYAYLRGRTLTLQASAEPEGFLELAGLVSETRAVWQQKEAAGRASATATVVTTTPHAAMAVEYDDGPRLSWSA